MNKPKALPKHLQIEVVGLFYLTRIFIEHTETAL